MVETENQALSTPSGWNLIGYAESPSGSSYAKTMVYAFWKLATSSSEGSASVGDSGNHQIGIIVTMRNCNTSTPVEGYATSASDGNTDVGTAGATGINTINMGLVPNSIGVEKNNEMLWVIACGDDRTTGVFSNQADGGVGVALTSISEVADVFTSSGTGGGLGVFKALKASAGGNNASLSFDIAALNADQALAAICITFFSNNY